MIPEPQCPSVTWRSQAPGGILSGPRTVAPPCFWIPGAVLHFAQSGGDRATPPILLRSALQLTQALCARVWGLPRPDVRSRGPRRVGAACGTGGLVRGAGRELWHTLTHFKRRQEVVSASTPLHLIRKKEENDKPWLLQGPHRWQEAAGGRGIQTAH